MMIFPKRPALSNTSNKNNRKVTGWRAILARLTEPAPAIHEPEQQRRARLLSGLLVTQVGLSLLVTFLIIFFIDYHPGNVHTAIATTLILILSYFLSRTSHFDVAALLMIVTLAGAVFLTELIALDPSSLYFLVLGVLVSSLFLSQRATLLVMAIIMGGIGLLLWIFFPALSVRDALGAMFAVLSVGVLGIVGIAIRQEDLEEIQQQSVSLRQSEDRFHLVSYATNDVVWDWDLLTGQVWRNQSAQRLFGFRDDQMRPAIDWWEAQIHPDEREKISGSLHDAVKSGETFWSKEYRFQRADGSYIHVFDRAYIIHDEKHDEPIRVLGAIMDITAIKQAEEILRQESLRDPLTGLFNRRYMEEMLEREFNRAKRTQQQISIIMLDVDHFKQVNDTFGHVAGDALLHALGHLLLRHVRGTDIACRYGGDEFILILPGASLGIAQQRAEKICAGARDMMIEPYADLANIFSLSLGVATYPEQGASREAIFAAADAALYAAKSAGRNQVMVAQG